MAYFHINGHLVSEEDARISVKDRGFRFGDGVFETIAVYEGVPYQWEAHMERLGGGLSAIRIPYNVTPLEATAKELIQANDLQSGFLRISITRGEGSRGYLPVGKAKPTVVIEAMTRESLAQGAGITLWLSTLGVIPPRVRPAAAKTMQGLHYTLAKMEAEENSCDEALLLDIHDHISEGASSNIFWVKGNTLYTPALEEGGLPGTTRRAVLRLWEGELMEGEFTLKDLEDADEVFITNVSLLVCPVIALLPVEYSWKAGPYAEALLAHLKEDIVNYVKARQT